ncbi:hypothetical protein CsSME_00027509 [Camellia sinensis var. sinensis]
MSITGASESVALQKLEQTLLSQVGRQPPTQEAGQTVGGRVELVIYVVTLSCNIYFKFKILCKPHDCALQQN